VTGLEVGRVVAEVAVSADREAVIHREGVGVIVRQVVVDGLTAEPTRPGLEAA
jgi:hypothetical protein